MRSLILLVLFPCSLFAQNAFEALTSAVGINEKVEGLPDQNNIRDFGAGLSTADFTGDGLEDIAIATGYDQPVLFYQNNGDGTFAPLPDIIPQNTDFQKMVLFGDIDNDGDQDMFVTSWGGIDRLYRNDGNLQFTDITNNANLVKQLAESNGASFCDVNNDGLLDLYVCNREKTKYGNLLYINQGGNVFTEEARQRGVSDDTQLSFQSVFFDYDNDGDQDLYIANDRAYRNALYQNDGTGYFTDVSQESGTNIQIDAMNTGIGDMNNDGYLDIFVTNTSAPGFHDHLLLNNGDGTFAEVSTDVGADIASFTWAGLWLDYDNDTDEDLFVCTLKDQESFVWLQNYRVELGLDIFLNAYPAGLPGSNQVSFSAALFDYNNDGKLDIVTPNASPSPIQVWRNISENSNSWVKFELEGSISTRDAVGSKIEVFLGEQRLIRYLTQGDSYLSQGHGRLHFGLGAAPQIDSVVVSWMSGITDRYYNLATNDTYLFHESETNLLEINIESENPSCHDTSDGMVSAAALNGVAPFDFEWNTGSTSATLEELSAGRYLVTITDALGERGVGLVDLEIPEPITVTVETTNDSGSGDGTATAIGAGGNSIYSYDWSTGETGASINELEAAIYSVSVTDEKGCGASQIGVIYSENGGCAAFIPTNVLSTTTTATFSWGAVPMAKIYRLSYRELGTTIWLSPNGNTQEQALTIENLDPGVSYEYRTKTACLDGSFSDWSAIYTFQTALDPNSDCAAWEPSEIYEANNFVIFFFPDEAGASAYRIRYRELGTSVWSKTLSTYSTISIDFMTSGNEYEYQTSTRCGNGWTDWSETGYFDTNGDDNLFRTDDAALVEQNEVYIQVYPNPGSELLNINLVNGQFTQLEVYGANGKLYLSPRLNPQIDISTLESGVYYLKVYLEGGEMQVCRFMKL